MLDGYATSHRAVPEKKIDKLLPDDTMLRLSKYLNNLIEQDHRNLTARVNAMLGFKHFRTAATTVTGIELMHRIRKGQFNLSKLHIKDARCTPGLDGGSFYSPRCRSAAQLRARLRYLHHNRQSSVHALQSRVAKRASSEKSCASVGSQSFACSTFVSKDGLLAAALPLFKVLEFLALPFHECFLQS